MSDQTQPTATTETTAPPKSHHCGRPVRLGKKPRRHDHRTLRLARYLPTTLQAPPAACDWSTSAAPSWGMMLNDELGDCTCAAIGHAIQEWTAANGQELTPADAAILKAYEDFCGYRPGQRDTDQGGVEIDVLNGWRQTGVAGHRIKAYAELNTRDRQEVEQAIFLFGGAYLGLALPLSAQNQEDWTVAESGEQGDPTPGSWGGHAVFAVGYDADWVYFISWGRKRRMSWAFFIACGEEAYAVLSVDWADADGAPCKLDLDQLEKDLAEVTDPATSSRPEVALAARAAGAARARRLAEGIVFQEDMALDVTTRLSELGGGEVTGKNAAGIELGLVLAMMSDNEDDATLAVSMKVKGVGHQMIFTLRQLEPFVRAIEKLFSNPPPRRPREIPDEDEGEDAPPLAGQDPAPVAPPPAATAPTADVTPPPPPPPPPEGDQSGVEGEDAPPAAQAEEPKPEEQA